MDRGQRADPLIRHTVMNKVRCNTLESSGYGLLGKRPNEDGFDREYRNSFLADIDS